MKPCPGLTPAGDPCPCIAYAHQYARYCPICEHDPAVVDVDLIEEAVRRHEEFRR